MDTIFYNGKIYTGAGCTMPPTALAVKDGLITALGVDSAICSLADESTVCVNLQGKTIYPGFVDSHLHLLFYAQELSYIDLSIARSFEEVKTMCRERLSWARANEKWIEGTAFNQDDWDIQKIPTRFDLDQIATDVPILLKRICHHITVCNTKALELAGLMDLCPDGIFREDQIHALTEALPTPTLSDIKALIRLGCESAAKLGITEVHTDDFWLMPKDHGRLIMQAYREMAQEGTLPIRVYQQCNLRNTAALNAFLEAGHRTGDNEGFYTIGPLKLISDGSLGARTAFMKKPYVNDPSTCGLSNYTDNELLLLCQKAHDAGMQIAVHCIGDAALQQSLDVFSEIQKNSPREDTRHGIIHCQIMDADQQKAFAAQRLLAYVQPVFIRYDMRIVADCVGSELEQSSYNWRRFIDLGVHQSGGSDCPAEILDVLPGIDYAVNRADWTTGQVWYPQNGITLTEAIDMYTIEGAYASFSENRKGTLSVGKYADLVVLEQDLFQMPQEEIHNNTVLLTMVGGKLAYSDGSLT